jgi:hypothetical protein
LNAEIICGFNPHLAKSMALIPDGINKPAYHEIARIFLQVYKDILSKMIDKK